MTPPDVFGERRGVLIAAATDARVRATAYECLRLRSLVQIECRNRASAQNGALAALDTNVQPGSLAAELDGLRVQQVALPAWRGEARGDELATALRNALERLGPVASPAKVKATRTLALNT